MSLSAALSTFKKKTVIRYNRIPLTFRRILDFIRFILEYGALISIIMYGLFRVDIDAWRLLGFGIIYYFIMYEAKAIYSYWKG